MLVAGARGKSPSLPALYVRHEEFVCCSFCHRQNVVVCSYKKYVLPTSPHFIHVSACHQPARHSAWWLGTLVSPASPSLFVAVIVMNCRSTVTTQVHVHTTLLRRVSFENICGDPGAVHHHCKLVRFLTLLVPLGTNSANASWRCD